MKRHLLASACLLLASTSLAQAPDTRPPALEQLPPSLTPWVEFALDGYRPCQSEGPDACVWPGLLSLRFDEGGGSFSLQVFAAAEGSVVLPGLATLIPRDVRIDGRAAQLQTRDGIPTAAVTEGTHTLTGTFSYRELPEVLPLANNVGVVSLSLRGRPVPFPARNEEGHVWLRFPGEASVGGTGSLQVEVHRLLEDALPFRVTTRVVLRVSGVAREVRVGRAVLEGLTPVEIRSPLPTRLDADGALTVHVRAGTHTVEIVSLVGTPPSNLGIAGQPAPWPTQEIWVWRPQESLRQVTIEGVTGIDPSRTSLESDWHQGSVYAMDSSARMTFATVRRGEPESLPNQVSLVRELWLDADGQGLTGRDSFSGSLLRTSRLDLLEGVLGRATDGSQDLVITKSGEVRGVEVRSRETALVAEWRAPSLRGQFRAVGWSEDAQSLAATFHVPPGWTLLAASGADESPGAWIEQWDLFGFFFVLILSLISWKVAGRAAGVLMLSLLVLSYHESGAPFGTWIVLIPAALLAKYVKKPGLGRVAVLGYLGIALIAFAAEALPFGLAQIRSSLYPFLAEQSSGNDFGASMNRYELEDVTAVAVPTAQPAAPPPQEQAQLDGIAEEVANERGRATEFGAGYFSRSGSSSSATSNWFDPNQVVQTGPGVPNWSARSYALQWAGPVENSETVSLWLLSPTWNRLFSLSRVALMLAVLYFLWLALWKGRSPRGSKAPTASASVVTTTLLLLTFATPLAAHAQITDAQLAELRTRLLRVPVCEGNCVTTSDARVEASETELTVSLRVHLQSDGAVRLPGPMTQWTPTDVRVNGTVAHALRRAEDGYLFLRLPAGVHDVQLRGGFPAVDSLALSFGEPPLSVVVDAPAFDVSGLRTDGRDTRSIELNRRERATTEVIDSDSRLPSWLKVRREIELGVRWRVTTTVERVTPAGSPVIVRLPLLPGESVVDAQVEVEGDHLSVTLPRDQGSLSWSSLLEPRPALELRATEGQPFSEAWKLSCTPMWSCSTEGLVPVARTAAGSSEQEFLPWPGEVVQIHANAPEGAEGAARTIDEATLAVTPGARIQNSTLTFTLRASQGGTEAIVIPREAEVQSVRVGEVDRPVQRDDEGRLVFGYSPGSQVVQIRFQESRSLGTIFVTPDVQLRGGAVNLHVSFTEPHERWLLWASGPAPEVAVLFWGYVFFLSLLAYLFARLGKAPLKIHDYLILSLGLTQLPAVMATWVLAWFALLAWRARTPLWSSPWFEMRQLAVLGYTLVAVGTLYAALHMGLVMRPDMQIVSRFGGDVHWYVDRIEAPRADHYVAIPRASLISVSLWVWRVAMLVWALWLSLRLMKWGPWGLESFGVGGYFKSPVPAPERPATTSAAASTAAPAGWTGGAPTATQAAGEAAETEKSEPSDTE